MDNIHSFLQDASSSDIQSRNPFQKSTLVRQYKLTARQAEHVTPKQWRHLTVYILTKQELPSSYYYRVSDPNRAKKCLLMRYLQKQCVLRAAYIQLPQEYEHTSIHFRNLKVGTCSQSGCTISWANVCDRCTPVTLIQRAYSSARQEVQHLVSSSQTKNQLLRAF